MKNFIIETEKRLDRLVERDIIELGEKIHLYKTGKMPEDKFKSLRLARGVYGQRQLGVQMVRIKLPYGKLLAKQLVRIADVADEYSNGNLHLTTRQDIQIHFVSLDRTPELWAELEKDSVTLREACGNTVRNITASPFAGIDPDEPFDVSPYAEELFRYLLRNPVNQDMGRKVKISFSSSQKDTAYSFLHDLGFIPIIQNGEKGFKLLIAGGLGVKPFLGQSVTNFINADDIYAYTTAILRVFDRYGERQKRNKARLKYLVEELGLDKFLELVNQEYKVVEKYRLTIIDFVEPNIEDINIAEHLIITVPEYLTWIKTNVIKQKQKGFFTILLKITNGNIKSDIARKLAELVQKYSGGELRVTINQGLIIKYVREESLPHFYHVLSKLNLSSPGFDSVSDITACPGTDTCNLGITNSTNLAVELENLIAVHHAELVYNKDIKIKISGCFNACGQHSIANIGFHGSTIKDGNQLIPAVQLLMGGGVLGGGDGVIAEKIIKLPTKKAIKAVDQILNDYKQNANDLLFNEYFKKQGNHYFYNLLKPLANEPLENEEYKDWGQNTPFNMNIGVGECAGVVLDLSDAVKFEINERISSANETLEMKRYADSIYHSYTIFINVGKLFLLKNGQQYNSQAQIIETTEQLIQKQQIQLTKSFTETVFQLREQKASEEFARDYYKNAILFYQELID
ncbi:MAG: nitrite reductase [Bacteroidetes bacterium RIFCSPLOWO2_12_FULL_31_6]|nr:MAG: nitrite reductase [Bacteroidetes bacterium RIFCSPLOWO2_12_FULL_31_6]